jgi:hypothetical protein
VGDRWFRERIVEFLVFDEWRLSVQKGYGWFIDVGIAAANLALHRSVLAASFNKMCAWRCHSFTSLYQGGAPPPLQADSP